MLVIPFLFLMGLVLRDGLNGNIPALFFFSIVAFLLLQEPVKAIFKKLQGA